MSVNQMAGHLIRRLQQNSTQIFTKRMQAIGLDITSVQFAAMDAISAHPGIDQAGVAAQIAYDRATIGGVVDRLVQKGLVERSVSKQDRRARVLHLSPEGKKLLDQAFPEVAALQADILPGLTTKERLSFLYFAKKALNPPVREQQSDD